MVGGKEDTRQLLRGRILRRRVGIHWYLIAIFGSALGWIDLVRSYGELQSASAQRPRSALTTAHSTNSATTPTS